MPKRISLATIIIAFSLLDSSASVKPLPSGAVDWSKGVIVAHGECRVTMSAEGLPVDHDGGAVISLNRGRVDAYRRARERAVENMVQLVKGIRVDADTMLADLLERSDAVQMRIVNLIASRVKAREFPMDFATSGCRIELLIGDLLPAVPYTYPSDEFPYRIDNPIHTNYTGLIIDMRGLNVEPMILPSIFNEEGLEVYGRHMVDIRHATKYGIVAYADSHDKAMKNRAAGDHPYFTMAVREIKGCPVLADRDVRKIFSGTGTMEQLKKCRVIFIIDKTKK
jgi:hypothetical protein